MTPEKSPEEAASALGVKAPAGCGDGRTGRGRRARFPEIMLEGSAG